MIKMFGGLMRQNYFVATIQTFLDHLKERDRTGLTTWAEEQKHRRDSLDNDPKKQS